MDSIFQQAMQRGCYDEAKKHYALSAPTSKLVAQITATAALITLRVSVLFSFFLFCRQDDEAPGHTKVGTEVIVVKSLNVFVETVQSITFMTAVKRRTKRIGPGLTCKTETQTIDPTLMFKRSPLSINFPELHFSLLRPPLTQCAAGSFRI